MTEAAPALPNVAPRPPGAPPWRPGLRSVLAAAFGGLGLLAALASSWAAGEMANRRLRADIGAELAAIAERTADLLDRGLHDRLREIRMAATLEPLRDPESRPAQRRELLAWLQHTYPEYAILLFISAEGRVLETSRGVLEGSDVAHRDYFRAARDGPLLVDVHDAILMSPLLGRSAENPARFVDVAAPVVDEAGKLRGVLAAHLYWEWAEDIERHVMATVLQRHPGAEALLLSAEGQVLIGPPALRQARLPALAPGAAAELAAGRGGSRVEQSLSPRGEPERYLVGYAPTRGWRGTSGLGWQVLVRRPAGAAFAPAGALAREVMLWGLGAAALAALLGWQLAGIISAPLARLGRAAAALERDPAAAPLPPVGGPREVAALSAALSGLVQAVRSREAALHRGAARLRLATEGAGIGAWEYDPEAGISLRSPRHDAIFGLAPGAPWSPARLLRQVAPEERGAVLAVLREAGRQAAEWQLQCRIRRVDDGAERWVALRGAPLRDACGMPRGAHRQAGIVEDVTERRRTERALELLVRELDHRVKNQFAVFDSLVQFTARTAADTASMAATLRGRVRALGAAHDLVREAAGSGVARGLRPTRLDLLVQAVLGPFGTAPPVPAGPAGPAAEAAAVTGPETAPGTGPGMGAEAGEGRVRLSGPAVEIGPAAAAALALALHELATNAARHGALSRPQGRVAIAWEVPPGLLRLRWVESGGPPVSGPPARQGFGTTLVRQTLCGQLGGQLSLDWSRPEGLLVRIELPADRLPG
ncbi:HWE histidine kinase domain-containing protein [Pseudoroseomonas cervicalis]|uniref:HWE histidine kinase domain-containing protein n=1 Tax=Teichococcus cervicalis TaxID=204525 RepID=UPI002787A210|nr:HWE histidine kinase domain-containing protein [Pseudoroseomonas cervicalis]MDQ1077879.1 PAS domain S-box-containing protein [Pseudoroseomonas cervicalis]